MINVGDIALLKLSDSISVSELPSYTITVTSVSGNTLTGVDGFGKEHTVNTTSVQIIATYDIIISQFVAKGVELDARVAQG